jgi:ketosteroid isomerase-like protein
MSNSHDIQANKVLARRFIQAVNTSSARELDAILHKDFVWTTAVVADDAPNELPPLQSNKLKGTNLPHPKPRLNRAESMAFFTRVLGGESDTPPSKDIDLGGLAGDPNAEKRDYMQIKILSETAEEDRVSMEASSTGVVNPKNGRTYGNFYHFLFRIRDGKLVLLKEYQDTLKVYDFVCE